MVAVIWLHEEGSILAPITVLIADDHPLLRQGLRQILELEPDIKVVGEAANGLEAVERVQALHPDVIILDINMPVMNGLEAAQKIREAAPETKIVALTIHDDKDYILEILRSGAQSYLLKDSEPGRVAAAVRQVAAGEAYLSGRLMGLVLQDYREVTGHARRLPPDAPMVREAAATAEAQKTPAAEANPDPGRLVLLSEREYEILSWIVAGKSNREIASGLFISEKTVKNHVSNILRKLDLSDRTQAAVYGLRHGVRPPEDMFARE